MGVQDQHGWLRVCASAAPAARHACHAVTPCTPTPNPAHPQPRTPTHPAAAGHQQLGPRVPQEHPTPAERLRLRRVHPALRRLCGESHPARPALLWLRVCRWLCCAGLELFGWPARSLTGVWGCMQALRWGLPMSTHKLALAPPRCTRRPATRAWRLGRRTSRPSE